MFHDLYRKLKKNDLYRNELENLCTQICVLYFSKKNCVLKITKKKSVLNSNIIIEWHGVKE